MPRALGGLQSDGVLITPSIWGGAGTEVGHAPLTPRSPRAPGGLGLSGRWEWSASWLGPLVSSWGVRIDPLALSKLGWLGVHLGAYLAYVLPWWPDRVVGCHGCLLPLLNGRGLHQPWGARTLDRLVQQGERAPRTREHPSPLRVGTSMLTQCTQGVETA